MDDFEVCNPLGAFCTKRKLCSVYWTSQQGHTHLYPLALGSLDWSKEEWVWYRPESSCAIAWHISESYNPSCVAVAADNLAVYSKRGIIESFSSKYIKYICRLFTATKSDIQTKEVRSGGFNIRTTKQHESYDKTTQERGETVVGWGECVYSPKTSFQHLPLVSPRHSPLTVWVLRNIFYLECLNNAILNFPSM